MPMHIPHSNLYQVEYAVKCLSSLQGCIFHLPCSQFELTKDYVFTSAYVKIFRTVTRNAVNKSV